MPPLRPVDYRTLARVFERDGFAFNRQCGDRLIYTKTGVKRPVVSLGILWTYGVD